MRSLTIILLVLLTGLQYKLWLGDNNIWQSFNLHEKIAQQEAINRNLFHSNAIMMADIEELKSGEQALEEHARYELGMIHDTETYYQFVD